MQSINDGRRLTEWKETKKCSHLWAYGFYCEADGPIHHGDDRIVPTCNVVTVHDCHDDRGRVSRENKIRNRRAPTGINTRLDMRNVAVWGLEQVEHEVACFVQLDGAIIEGGFRSKGLMKESPVQTPPVVVGYHDRVECPSETGVE